MLFKDWQLLQLPDFLGEVRLIGQAHYPIQENRFENISH
jgi:hypothetical protein